LITVISGVPGRQRELKDSGIILIRACSVLFRLSAAVGSSDLPSNIKENPLPQHETPFDRFQLKIQCLIVYGKNGKVQCCWRGCQVTNADMLTIDHVEDNGCDNRLPGGRRRGGSGFHRWLIKNNFPPGLQTLCCNHQQLKEIRRRRKKVATPPKPQKK
jgi:hypothetical protein